MSKSFPQSSWELETPSWEQQSATTFADTGSEYESSDEEPTRESAGAALIKLLLSSVWNGRMSAKTACSISHYASLAGAEGCGGIALKPASPTGHFQRKIDRFCGIDLREHRHYLVNATAHDRHQCSRTTHRLPMRLPHECVEEEFREQAGGGESQWRLATIVSQPQGRTGGRQPSSATRDIYRWREVLESLFVDRDVPGKPNTQSTCGTY